MTGYKKEIRRIVNAMSDEDRKRVVGHFATRGTPGVVFAGVMNGLKNHEIAQKLDRHQTTVQSYLRAVHDDLLRWIQRDESPEGREKTDHFCRARVASIAYAFGDLCQHEVPISNSDIITTYIVPKVKARQDGRLEARCPICGKLKRKTTEYYDKFREQAQTMYVWTEAEV